MNTKIYQFNPLLANRAICSCIVKIQILKRRRDHRKISYVRRVYESVDDMSQPKIRSKNLTGKFSGSNGLIWCTADKFCRQKLKKSRLKLAGEGSWWQAVKFILATTRLSKKLREKRPLNE